MILDEKAVFTDSKDFPLSTLKEMLDDGDIVPNPDYQRDYVYDSNRASKLIESLLMNIPIPTIYFCQENDETYSVIDGQQRITSLVNYLKNQFPLIGLQELPSINGKYYRDLEKAVQKRLKSSSLRAIVILKESQEIKYEIFARLNQGSVSLKPQELRNCLYRGSFNAMLENLSHNKYLPILFHDENKRKVYQERILRFFALRNYTEYKSSIKKTMNAFMREHQNDETEKIENFETLFNQTIDIIKQILGNDAFFAIDRDKNSIIEKFSGSVYDSIIIPFSFFDAHDLMSHADKIREQLNDLKRSNEQYREDTYAATGSKKRVIGRIQQVYNLIGQTVGLNRKSESRTFPEEVKKTLFHKGYICNYCKNEILNIEDAEVDHVVPFSLGGNTDISNAQLLHRHCNREKNNSIDIPGHDFEEDETE